MRDKAKMDWAAESFSGGSSVPTQELENPEPNAVPPVGPPEEDPQDSGGSRMLERLAGKRWLRLTGQFVVDALAWMAAVVAAYALRMDFEVSSIHWRAVSMLWIALVAMQLLVGGVASLYRFRHNYGSFENVRHTVTVSIFVVVVCGFVNLFAGSYLGVPRSVVFIAWPVAVVFMLGARYLRRLFNEREIVSPDAKPAIIYGAGFIGELLIRKLRTDPKAEFRAVALLDDDLAKGMMSSYGVRVAGTFKDLAKVVQDTGATTLILAIGDPSDEMLNSIVADAKRLGLQVKVVPKYTDPISGKQSVGSIRDLRIEDIVGRTQVDLDVENIAGYITGKRVLITGAGGSIGTELCRQVNRFGPAELILVDQDETHLQGAEFAISGNGLLATPEVVLVNIRDAEALNRVFQERRPQVVFHTAALKHLPMLEQYPEEAWKTNVLGTLNVLRAARAVDVDMFVNISTDKAANPTSVLGYSKRVAERLTAWMAQDTNKRYLSVRFGNVFGSRGSMGPLFLEMIRQGKPITITHPDVERYFMSIPEACQLVIQAGGLGRPGEVMILDMGKPVKILDVAKKMIDISGRDDIPIVFTGLRQGEKMSEILIADGEEDERKVHSKISQAVVPPLAPVELNYERWRTENRISSDVQHRSAMSLITG
jgi:FlaA1/EpsC-like NDP-sugar epimerase